MWSSMNFSSLAAAPNMLSSWVQQLQQSLPPSVNATAKTGNDALGNPCTVNSCSVTLTVTWNQLGGARTQVFNENFGF